MNADWNEGMLSEFIDVNPKEILRKGTIATKIEMADLDSHCRDVHRYSICNYYCGSKFRNGDTIMARITPCLENGKCSQVNILEKDSVGFGSTEFIVFRNKNGISDKDFVYYLICDDAVRAPAVKSMIGTSGRQRTQIDVIKHIYLKIPPLHIQKHISKILSSLDDKIELNNKINENLQQQAQALFKSWFIDFKPWGGIMPKNWRGGKISDLGDVVGGSTPSKNKQEYYTNKGIPWITPKDLSIYKSKFIEHGQIDITEDGLNNSSAKIMPKGSVLFSSRAPIGYIAIASCPVTTNQGFKSVVPFKNIGTPYVYFFLQENLSIIENMASGTTFKEVSGSVMKSVPALIPADDVLSRFNAFCSPLFLHQEQLEQENRRLSQLRDTLLPKLMSGELDVSSIEL